MSASPYLPPPEDLAELLPDEPTYRADQLRRWLYETPVLRAEEMTNLPSSLRRILEPLWPFRLEMDQRADRDRTRKWLLRTPAGAAIEAVVMAYPGRTTLCVSSQVGCAMACTFCATGQFGFDRHLEAGEIVAQVAFADAILRLDPMPGAPPRVTNLVFMGMGEPLANYDRLREALRRLVEVRGTSARSITVSTVGLVPGIRRLAAEPWPVELALSLHAADDATRIRLVPVAGRRYPLEEVIEAAAEYRRAKRRRVTIEWTLIADVNDTPSQADGLVGIARRLRALVNLIPLNPTPLSDDRPSPPERIEAFRRRLAEAGVTVTVRETRGTDIDAACGQLRVRAAGAAGAGPPR